MYQQLSLPLGCFSPEALLGRSTVGLTSPSCFCSNVFFLIGPCLKQTLHFGLHFSRTPHFSYLDFVYFLTYNILFLGFPCGSVVKNLPANEGDAGHVGSIPGSGRPPGGGNDNLLQCSCLENPVVRGGLKSLWTIFHGVAKAQT